MRACMRACGRTKSQLQLFFLRCHTPYEFVVVLKLSLQLGPGALIQPGGPISEPQINFFLCLDSIFAKNNTASQACASRTGQKVEGDDQEFEASLVYMTVQP